jgi:hypothetical protein
MAAKPRLRWLLASPTTCGLPARLLLCWTESADPLVCPGGMRDGSIVGAFGLNTTHPMLRVDLQDIINELACAVTAGAHFFSSSHSRSIIKSAKRRYQNFWGSLFFDK